MKLYVHEYKVIGSHDFPFDMLRYDHSYPAREAEIEMDLAPHFGGPRFREIRVVSLRCVAPKPWHPTDARWDSFGWKVVPNSHRVVTEATQ